MIHRKTIQRNIKQVLNICIALLSWLVKASSAAVKHKSLKDCSIVFLITPLDCWLIIHSQNEIGEELKEVLPQEQRDKEGEVAYINLTAVTGEVHVTQAVELVEQVLAEAPVQTWVRAALINVLLTPAGNTASSHPQEPGMQSFQQARV